MVPETTPRLTAPLGHQYILDPILHSGTHLPDPTPFFLTHQAQLSGVPPRAAHKEALALL